jgi:plastocyanin
MFVKFVVLKKGSIIAVIVTFMIITIGAVWVLTEKNSYPTVSMTGQKETIPSYQLVTVEYSSKTDDGKEIEMYRWDPGTINIEKGKEVELRLYGVNGMEHPFYIEGTDVKGTVKKGEETVVNVKFDEEGTYRLVCETHHSIENHGPMVAHIIVD